MFNPGDVVVCVDPRNSAGLLRQGAVYTIAMSSGGYVALHGVPFWRPGFYPRRFRRRPRPTDISIFTAIASRITDARRHPADA